MRWGWIGGVLIIGGTVLTLPAAALGAVAPGDDPGRRDLGDLLMSASLVLLGSGAGVLGVFGPKPLNGRGIRIGLGALAVGLLSFLVMVNVPLSGHNELTSTPWVASAILGVVAAVLGSVLVVAALVRTPGPTRPVGSLFIASPFMFLLAVPLADELRELALIPLVLGVIGIGVLAIRGERSGPATSSTEGFAEPPSGSEEIR